MILHNIIIIIFIEFIIILETSLDKKWHIDVTVKIKKTFLHFDSLKSQLKTFNVNVHFNIMLFIVYLCHRSFT